MLDLPFANHTTYSGHSGVDFPYRSGTPILASGAGTVTKAGWINDRAGYGVIIAYDGGPDVLYCHMRAASYPPTRVGYGTVIGEVGNTGNSTGPHLHMEIMRGAGAHTYAGVWRHFYRDKVVTPKPRTTETEGQEMRNAGVYYQTGDSTVYLIFNTVSGWFHEFSNGAGNGPMPGGYNNALAGALDTPSWANVTEAHARVIKESLMKVGAR